jgi:nucleoside-diphosphate-sugar epimerase
MAGRVFVAGATGAIGRPLCRLLVADGWTVFGTTRRAERAQDLRALGVEPVVVDVYDAGSLREAVVAARPDAVLHQLTDLPAGLDPAQMAEGRQRNTRLREIGTRNLVAAAAAAHAQRLVAQSLGFAYAPATRPIGEDAPIDPAATGVISLETQVLGAGGVVLRYGRLYGPGTGFATNAPAPVHVDAAADAARRALTRGSGVYNIAEADGELDIGRARRDLGWDPSFRIGPAGRSESSPDGWKGQR